MFSLTLSQKKILIGSHFAVHSSTAQKTVCSDTVVLRLCCAALRGAFKSAVNKIAVSTVPKKKSIFGTVEHTFSFSALLYFGTVERPQLKTTSYTLSKLLLCTIILKLLDRILFKYCLGIFI